MPRYTYKCEKCGAFERVQRITDAPLKTGECPTVGCKGTVQRLVPTGTSVRFKGSGWTPKFHR